MLVSLARTGVMLWCWRKHADFLRDFRGDTIHPSTLEVMYELGLLDEFLKRPHQEERQLADRSAANRRDSRFHPPSYPLQISRADAAVGFLNFIAEQAALSVVSPEDGGRSHPDRRRSRKSVVLPQTPKESWKFSQILR